MDGGPPRSTLFLYTTLFRSDLRRLAIGIGLWIEASDIFFDGSGLTLRRRPVGFRRRHAVIAAGIGLDRKSTRLNSSHTVISYAVFCLKKKRPRTHRPARPLW